MTEMQEQLPTTASGKLRPSQPVLGGFFNRRVCLAPTRRFFIAGVLLALVLALAFAWSIYPFLAVNSPLGKGQLVVEGWLSDKGLERAISEFREGQYDFIYVTGGPIESGGPLMNYKSYAELCAAVLRELGMDTNRLQAVPAPRVAQDRTYTSALALRRWLELHDRKADHLTVVTESAHARRSRLLFRKAFRSDAQIGTLALHTTPYDMRHWWTSSPGVREVIGETLAYLYARVLFWPEAPEALQLGAPPLSRP